MKRKLLSLLMLLMTAVTGAVAAGYNVTFDGFLDPDMNTTVNVASFPQHFTEIESIDILPWLVFDNGVEFLNVTSIDGGNGKVSASINGPYNMSITVSGTFDGEATIHVSGLCNQDESLWDDEAEITVKCAPNDPTVVASGSCGTGFTYLLTSDGVMTISGTGAMEDYSNYYSTPWYSNIEAITNIVIGEGVTSIGNHAFDNCEYATSVSIPASVTSIGDYAFRYCGDNATALTLTIAAESALTTIGEGAFYGCISLTSFSFPSTVTTIGDIAFYDCKSIASISIPASVTSIGESAFYNCGYNAAALTVAFAPESALTTIGDNAFGSANLTSITIPASVTTIGSMAFYRCESLASVSIPPSVTTIGYSAFEGCSTLTTINIPASVTRIGANAFSGCTNLTSVTLNSNPSFDYSPFPSSATVTMMMNLTNNLAAGAYWTTFYNELLSFQADANTQVFKVALSGDKLTMHEVEDRIVDEGTAVVLKSTGNPVMTLTADRENTVKYDLIGVNDPEGKENDGTFYVLNYTEEDGVGFYKLDSEGKVGLGKAYLTYDDGGGDARGFFLFNDATGIESVSLNDGENGEVYDLQGRRVAQPGKGLYIVSGKKYIKK